jgi:hypothetical protein
MYFYKYFYNSMNIFSDGIKMLFYKPLCLHYIKSPVRNFIPAYKTKKQGLKVVGTGCKTCENQLGTYIVHIQLDII